MDTPDITPHKLCKCGQPLMIEMEFDAGICLDCQCNASILSGKAMRNAKVHKLVERMCSL